MRGEFVDVAGSRLYYYAAGTRGAGEPVIFIHGFPASSHLWRDVVRQMPMGHRLVVLDLLGFGRSDRPGDASALTAMAHAERVRALMDELGIERTCLVGHAMGGAVAQALALRWPGRVSRLGLVNSVAFDAWPRRAARLARTLCAGPGVGRALGAPLLAGLVHGSLLAGFGEKERARHSLDQYLHAFTGRLGVDVLAAQLRAMRDETVASLGAALGTIHQPTSIIWGAADPFLSSGVGERLRDTIPGATLELIAHARHFLPEDAPDRVATAIGALLRR
ncbi:MAG TPA: alpha/beta fold hydrolase [Gemmatimonadaceae bacterium]|nr:alpha/beta fold hydrolase [Gemmatimonadaceae bacterium]